MRMAPLVLYLFFWPSAGAEWIRLDDSKSDLDVLDSLNLILTDKTHNRLAFFSRSEIQVTIMTSFAPNFHSSMPNIFDAYFDAAAAFGFLFHTRKCIQSAFENRVFRPIFFLRAHPIEEIIHDQHQRRAWQWSSFPVFVHLYTHTCIDDNATDKQGRRRQRAKVNLLRNELRHQLAACIEGQFLRHQWRQLFGWWQDLV